MAVLPRVRAIAKALVRDPADVDDAVQEVSVQILRSLSKYRGEGSLDAWAARLAERHVLRHIDRKRRRWSRSQPVERERIEGEAGPESPVRLEETLPRNLREYLGELPEPQRQTLVLRYAFGHSLAEIAELTGVGVSTVRGRLRLGSESLRKAVRRDRAIGRPKR